MKVENKSIAELTCEDWYDLYVNKKLLHREIAEKLNIDKWTVYKHLKNCAINEDVKKNSYIETPLQRDLIIGSLLGDGSLLFSERSKNPYFKIAHNETQLGYLKAKRHILNDFCTEGKELHKYINKRFPDRLPMYDFHTKSLPLFHKYNSMSIVDLLYNININSLFVWYLDDGNLQQNKYANITCASFTLDECNFAIDALSKKFNINANIIYSKREKNGFQGIFISRESTSHMIELFKTSELYKEFHDTVPYKLILTDS